jgi:hypothetical protein
MLLKPNTQHQTVHIDSVDKNTIMSTVNTYFTEHHAHKAKVSIEIWNKLMPRGSSFLSNVFSKYRNILPASSLESNEIVFIWQ